MVNRLLQKLALWPPLLVAACLLAGGYGAIHDQLSYTLSPDYFHAFKFQQFAIRPQHWNRLGVAVVGWRATWWMGVLAGVPILVIGMVTGDWRKYVRRTLMAYLVAIATAAAVGLAAMAVGSSRITEASLGRFGFPPGVDRVAFARVGFMHKWSYMGGGIGCLAACVYLGWSQLRALRTPGPYDF